VRKPKVLKGQKSLMFDQPTTDYDVLAAFRNTDEWLSRKTIAERCLRVKSPSLIQRIERLVSEGYILKEFSTLPNGVDMCIYKLARSLDVIPF